MRSRPVAPVLSSTVCLLLAATLGVGVAHAQVIRVAVQRFAGSQSARVRADLIASLQGEERVELVSRDEVRAAAEELGVGRRALRREDYPLVAERLRIAAFIEGRVTRVRRRWSVRVSVVNGADGEPLGSAHWGGRTLSAFAAVRRNGYERIAQYLFNARAPAPEQQYRAQQSAIPWYAAADHGAGGGATSASDGRMQEGPGGDAARSEAGRYSWFEVSLLGGLLHRSMQAEAEVALPRDDPASGATQRELRDYTSGGAGHFEAGLRVELYPGAAADAQQVPWFGIVGSYRHSLFLSSQGCEEGGRAAGGACSSSSALDIPTTQDELYVGARARVRLGDAHPTELSADVGYGSFTFALQESFLRVLERRSVIPPVTYSYVQLGAGVRYEAVKHWLALGARAAYRLGLGVGRTAQEVWGVDTRDVSGFSLGADLRTEAPYIAEGVFLGISLDYFRFGVTWRGQTACVDGGADGACYDGRAVTTVDAGEAWEPWPHGATFEDVTGGIPNPVGDSYVRVSLAIGYALR